MKTAQWKRNWMMVLVLILGFQVSLCQAVGTAITYQGKLEVSGELGAGQYDFTFEVFSDALATISVGGPVAVDDLDVEGGLFTRSLDFGAGVFTGADRWLKISVRDGASVGAYTPLLPAQKVTATPYALFTANGENNLWTQTGSNIYYDSGRVGIGTTNPTEELTVVSDSTTGIRLNNTAVNGDVFIGFDINGSRKFAMGVDDSDGDKFKIGTAGLTSNNMFVIDSAGNIGIGMDAPLHPLHVQGDVHISSGFGGLELVHAATDDGWAFSTTGGGATLLLRSRDAGLDSTRIAIAANGNVGLGGDTSPHAQLTVTESIGFTNGTTPMMYMFESGTVNPRRTIISHSPSYPT